MCPDARRTKQRQQKRYEKAESLAKRALSRRKGTSKRKPAPTVRTLLGGWVLNPYLAFLLFLGVGIATFRLEHNLRLTLLWLMLLGIVLLYAETGRLKASYSLLNLSRGALVGIIVALPFYLFANDFFYVTASKLFGVDDWQVLLERAVFLVPILEESFFRGVVQRERGLLDGALLFGLAQGLYFVSGAYEFVAVIAAVALGMGLLGLLLGYLYQRYGLTASIACHVAVNLVLFVLPVLGAKVSELLAF